MPARSATTAIPSPAIAAAPTAVRFADREYAPPHMEHLRRLYRVWNWLPAFRAVAETEHLPTASDMLHVTPSALSRSIKQLEEELGQPLFRRVGRRLELSPAGEELLHALRDSMSRLDRGLSAASTSQFIGPVRISA